MKYIPEDWEISVSSTRPKGMSVPEPRSSVKFKYLQGNIKIEYGEEKTQIKNRDVIISLIELL